MTPNELRRYLGDPEAVKTNPFGLLKQIYSMRNEGTNNDIVQEMILRALEQRDSLGNAATLLDALVRDAGLFPYLDPASLSLADLLAFEAHRPPNIENIVFHHPQAKIFHTIMSGESVVLSAPTSFGKTLIIDAIIATRRFRNIVLVAPTLALIDETRKRLSQFRNDYTIITQAFQTPGERNVYIMTQERVLDSKLIGDVDFFVIDEFYKLSPHDQEDDRSALLNQVFYTLTKKCKHFYLLGPGIGEISDKFKHSLKFRFFHEPYQTVVSELHRVTVGKRDRLDVLKELAENLSGPTIVFCSSPESARIAAEILPENSPSPSLTQAAEWIADNYHPDWHLVRDLKRGIGIHHGRIPRALAQYMVRSFNNEELQFLVCTSTLIEGVNTRAKNIIIFDHKINRRGIDLFTFNNIRGRSGRMFQHFVGHVYHFQDPPQDELPLIDIPAFTQGASAPESLLIQLEENDLTEEAEQRIQRYRNHHELPFDVIKSNVGVPPGAQIALAEELASNAAFFSRIMNWHGIPNYNQRLFVCELMWKIFNGKKLAHGSIRSAKHLCLMLSKLHRKPHISELVASQVSYSGSDADVAVKIVLDFIRTWACFHFPKLLRAIGRIQHAVFSRRRLPTGDYDQYANLVERLFLDPVLTALEEYGIPLPLARKIGEHLGSGISLDDALSRLRGLNLQRLDLSEFERWLIDEARESL